MSRRPAYQPWDKPKPKPVIVQRCAEGCGAFGIFGFGPPGFGQAAKMRWYCADHMDAGEAFHGTFAPPAAPPPAAPSRQASLL